MNDRDGPSIARHVYQELFRGAREYFDPDDVPHALDVAVQELRIAGVDVSRWATYVHIGM